MLDVDTKRIINNARDILVGKVPNPQSQVDLITIAMIYKFMDDMDLVNIEYNGKATFFVDDIEPYAFHKLLDPKLGNQARLNLYAEALDKLPTAKSVPELFRTIFRGAFLPFRDPATLTMFLKEINNFTYDNSENLGNAFEYLLSIMGSQGDAGQFRTPRHIIDFIVDVVNPTKTDTILDPACGTAGFLISAYLHIKNNTKDMSVSDMKTLTNNIVGYDISPDMRKLALVNLYLHNFAEPKIYEYDTLTSDDRWADKFDVILANPPFMTPKGGIQPHGKFSVRANRSEVLFVDYIAEHLTLSGRAGIIVPEGVIFTTNAAYKQLRQMLVDDHYLYAVISLPSGVFNPYSGVKTSILLFDRQLAKQKKDILFIKIENDGFDLGAQRKPIAKNDLPETMQIIKDWKSGKDISKYTRALSVPKETIAENGEYNLTSGRYQTSISFDDCKYKIVKLGDLCNLVRGITYSKEDEVENDGSKVFRANNIDLSGTLNFDDIKEIRADIKLSDEKKLHKNDIFICLASGSKQHIGKVAFIKNDMDVYFGGFMGVIRTNENVIPEYLFALLKTDAFNNYLNSAISGVNINNLSAKILSDFSIPLPPLDVQKQIVAEIENKQQIIDNTRQIIRNLERERQYFANLLDGIDYTEVSLGDVCQRLNNTVVPATIIGNIDYIGLENIEPNTGNLIGNILTSAKTIKSAKSEFVRNNILYGKLRPNLNKVYLAKSSGICSTDIIVCEATNKIVPKYLAWILRTKEINEKILGGLKGAQLPRVDWNYMSNIKIPLPSLADQERIVAQLDAEQAIVDTNKQLIDLMQKKIDSVISRIYKCKNDPK